MTTDQAATAAATDNVAKVRTAYAAFAAGDVPVVLATLHPDVEWVEAAGSPYGGTYRGPQAVAEGVLARIGGEWTQFRVEPDEYVASGETVAVLGTYRGAHGATGRTMEARFAHLWWFRGGQAVRFEQVADTATFNSVLP